MGVPRLGHRRVRRQSLRRLRPAVTETTMMMTMMMLMMMKRVEEEDGDLDALAPGGEGTGC